MSENNVLFTRRELMNFDTGAVVKALVMLERQVPCFRTHYRELRDLTGRNDHDRTVAVLRQLRDAQTELVQTIGLLRSQVLACDGERVGKPESIPELAARAALHVIAVCTQSVAILRSEAEQASHRALFVGRFRGIDDVVDFTRRELVQIHTGWLQCRSGHAAAQGTGDSVPGPDRDTLYRSAVNGALRSIRGLGDDFDYVHFLCEGMTGSTSPTVRAACSHILTVINLRLDTESRAVQSAVRRGVMRAR